MNGGELFFSLLTGAAGYMLTDFLDRWLAAKKAEEGGSAEHNAAVISGGLDWKRGLAQVGVAAGSFYLAGMAKKANAKAALQGLGFGAGLHLAVQGGKMLVYRLLQTEWAQKNYPTLSADLYPDVARDYPAAEALMKSAPYGGDVKGLPYGAMGQGPYMFAPRPTPFQFHPSLMAAASGPSTGHPAPMTSMVLPSTPSAPVMSDVLPGLTTRAAPPRTPSMEAVLSPSAPMGPSVPAYGIRQPTGSDCSGQFPCPPVMSASTAAQMQQLSYNAAMRAAQGGGYGGGDGTCGNRDNCLSGIPKVSFDFKE